MEIKLQPQKKVLTVPADLYDDMIKFADLRQQTLAEYIQFIHDFHKEELFKLMFSHKKEGEN